MELINDINDKISCSCGRTYKQFFSYKKHFMKYKCAVQNIEILNKTTSQPIINKSIPPKINVSETQIITNTLIKSAQNTNVESEFDVDSDTSEESINMIPTKTTCEYCKKEYTLSNIARHKKTNCKKKYMGMSEYKYLLTLNLPDIPEKEIEIKELYYRLIYMNQIEPIKLKQNIIYNSLHTQDTTQDTAQYIIQELNSEQGTIQLSNQPVNPISQTHKNDYIYLIQKYDMNSQKFIYKIGKTKRHYTKRIREHGKEAKLLFIIDVDDCSVAETVILNLLNTDPLITNCKNIGTEYFYCDEKSYIVEKILSAIRNR